MFGLLLQELSSDFWQDRFGYDQPSPGFYGDCRPTAPEPVQCRPMTGYADPYAQPGCLGSCHAACGVSLGRLSFVHVGRLQTLVACWAIKDTPSLATARWTMAHPPTVKMGHISRAQGMSSGGLTVDSYIPTPDFNPQSQTSKIPNPMLEAMEAQPRRREDGDGRCWWLSSWSGGGLRG